MDDRDQAKRLAARAALELLPDSGVVGLGSGSTAKLFIDEVSELVRGGRRLVGVATSEASRRQATNLGIPLLDDEGPWPIDVCVDGADEVSGELDLIKGGGGCQTREKIINFSSQLNVIIVDESKLSSRLGEKWPVPLEILAFGRLATVARVGEFGEVRLRERDGAAWRSDAGNYLYDLHVGPIADPRKLDQALRSVPGVVETGLFCGRADRVIVAGSAGVSQMRRG
jgi:ribose 5-phosphate isomerase A